MRTLKFLSIFLFLAIFINSKANAPILHLENKKDFSSKIITLDQKINADDKNDDSPHKRKRRPRATEVDIPYISDISFEQNFVYKAFRLLLIEETYSSFLHCVDLKRGPPLS